MSSRRQYRRQAEEWTERAYADPGAYLAHRAELIASLGTPLERGDTVLDLACGDAGLGEALLARGLAYRGVDSTPEMVEQARRRLGERAVVDLGDLNDYVPPEPVAATTVFRAIYYARDRRAFFAHVATFTEKKLVFDLNPRQYRARGRARRSRRRRLRAGRAPSVLRPADRPAARRRDPGAKALERSGPLARLALRFRFTYVVAAARGGRR